MTKQQGFSLVEAMLTLVIGLVITASFLQLMVGASKQSRFQESLATSQENGRYSLYLLSKKARMAGHWTELNRGKLMPFYTGSCNGAPQCTFNGSGNDSDQIAIQYEPSVSDRKDCVGNDIPAGEITVDIYYIADEVLNGGGGATASSLYCSGFNPDSGTTRGTPRALVHGVDMMQVVYGVAPSGSANVDRYLVASAVSDWSEVRSIRIGLLVQSGLPDRKLDRRTRTYDVLDRTGLTYPDEVPRYVYTTAVSLNNAGL